MIIAKLLGVSKLDFVNYQTQEFSIWCVMHAKKNFIPSRLLDTNEGLFNWYCGNWEVRLNTFLDEHKDYIDAGVVNSDVYLDLFNDAVPLALQKVYPTTLLEEIKKQHYETIGITYPYKRTARKRA